MLFGEGPQIKNIAADLNKLFRQGSLLNQSGQTVEGDSTADQGTSDLLAARDPVIQEISVGMSGEQSARYTVSGAPPLSLPNSLGKPLKAWSVDVLPKQDLNGYDNPWPAGGGVNKFDEQVSLGLLNSDGSISQTVGRLVTDFIPVEAGKEYAFVWPTNFGRGRGAFYDSSKNLVQYFGDFPSDTSHVESGYGLVTAPTGAAFLRINLTSLYGTTYNHDISVNYPSSVTTYTPYSNICPIYGTDKLNLFVEESYDQSATPKAVLTLPQTVYTGTIGNATGDSRSTIVDMGAQDWIYHSGFGVFYYVTLDGKPTGTGQGGYGMCEAYDVIEGTYYSNLTDGQIAVGTNFFSITTATVVVKDSRFTDAAQFKAAVSGIKLIYELATPTTFAVPSATIPTPTGTATTWATAEDGVVDSMEVTYVGKA